MPTPRSLVKLVLREAYRAIRAGYTTKTLARRENGEQCFVNDVTAVAWSLAGALQLGELHCAARHGAGKAWGAYSGACELIQANVPSVFNRNILRFGDAINQTQALAIIQRAGAEV